MDLEVLRQTLAQGGWLTLLMRHAERPPLDPTDTSFGMQLPITETGRETAVRLGRRMRDVLQPQRVALYAGETLRTIQTAECMHMGLFGGKEVEVRHEPVLGGASPFFGSLEERMALIAEGRYLDRLNDYYREGEQRGYRPLRLAAQEMENRLLALAGEGTGLTIAVTHDVNVASFLAGWGLLSSFTMESWPHYLDAAVILRLKDGSVSARGYLRP